MSVRRSSSAALAALAVMLVTSGAHAAVAVADHGPAAAWVAKKLPALPIAFVPNQGQWSSPELFRVTAGGLHAFLDGAQLIHQSVI